MMLKQIIPLFCVILLSYIGFSLALPIFPPLLLDPTQGMLDGELSKQMRNILLGILMAMYPIGQFFGCPILGKLSDRYGRKNILLFSLLGSMPVFCLSALSIQFHYLSLLFFSRFLCGILESNVVIAQASISDLSQNHHQKTTYFGYLVSLSSAGFIIGPLIGGKLTDKDVVSWFNNAIPFWTAAILAAFAFFLIAFLFKETKQRDLTISVNFRDLLRSYFKSFNLKHLKPIYTINFSLYLAIFFFFLFFPVLIIDRFNFTMKDLGYIESYFSLSIFIAPLFISKISKHYTPQKVMFIVGLLLAFFLLVFLLPTSSSGLFFTLPPVGFLCALSFTFMAIMISDRVDDHIQGEALGLNQSVQVFAEALTGLTGGLLASVLIELPILTGVGFCLIATLLLIIHRKKTRVRE